MQSKTKTVKIIFITFTKVNSTYTYLIRSFGR